MDTNVRTDTCAPVSDRLHPSQLPREAAPPVDTAPTLPPRDPAEDSAYLLTATEAVLDATMAAARPAADLEVAIPAYNEAARLPGTIHSTTEFLQDKPWTSRIVVVDNGSSDETAEVTRAVARTAHPRVPVDLVGCARPGKGAAVRRALLSSRSRFVGFFDADLATPVDTLTQAMDHLQHGAVAVIGSRHTSGAVLVKAQPRGRRLGGAVFRMAVRSLVQDVRDTQCGFKFFERRTVTRALASCRTTGFAFDVELLRQLQRQGEQIVEVPVAWSDSNASSFRPLQDGIASFGAVRQIQRSPRGWSW